VQPGYPVDHNKVGDLGQIRKRSVQGAGVVDQVDQQEALDDGAVLQLIKVRRSVPDINRFTSCKSGREDY